MNKSVNDLLQPVLSIAEKAGKVILDIYNSGYDVEKKDDNTPLTTADTAAHNLIVAELAKLTPDIPIISEEQADIPFEIRKSWTRYWLVDPLDGTREFIKRNGEFTVNIALIEHHYPILGAIYVPVSGVSYYAIKNQGAFKKSKNSEPHKIKVREVTNDEILIAGSRSHRDTSLDDFLERIGDHQIISMGSSLKSCLVAEGKVDIYPRLGPTSEWDTAAAQCIVEEAGGHLTNTDLQRLKYNTKDSLLNPHFLVFGDDSIEWLRYLETE